jgi:hypothetical protein
MAAELLMILALGALLFRVARPLRDRIERWFARNVHSESRGGRVVDLRPRNDGAFGAEDPDGD